MSLEGCYTSFLEHLPMLLLCDGNGERYRFQKDLWQSD